ncbi:hypothetical protein HSBAA_46510 [Vreelandella sulfidaeris]|uniref:Type VI secretion system tip protein VgrG n=1 Tax=Vreelandella sulfidaeris TaxID=115553 RepID=A0A455UBD7_9GAMM|nr:hypothetical protein HSBAA_46510 [Halomonas sulfidaeris]
MSFTITHEPEQREYCVQYRETDLAFIERLAAEEGLFYFHEFEEKDGGTHRLIFADDPKVLTSIGERTYHSRAGGTAPPAMYASLVTKLGSLPLPPRSKITALKIRPMHSYTNTWAGT